MKGYLKNPRATGEGFAGGWFHTGDLAVWHPDGYIELKDRSKDIIISGGENISSIEVEDALYRHPAVAGVAVVALPDDKWGEIRSEEHTSELQSLMRISYAVFCLQKKNEKIHHPILPHDTVTHLHITK